MAILKLAYIFMLGVVENSFSHIRQVREVGF